MTGGRALRIANVVMFVIFVSWAAFQYDDPDVLVWALVYGFAALCCLLFFLNRLSPFFAGAMSAGAAVWALVLLFFVLTAGESFSFVDEGLGQMLREALGLLTVAAWTGFLAVMASRRKQRGQQDRETNGRK